MMDNRNCAYHENRGSVKECGACGKPLCEDCIHADYAAYCWSCGYEHEQKMVEEEKNFVIPAFLEHKVVYYVLHKALAAAGAAVLCALACSLLLSMLAGPGAFVYGFYIAFGTLLVTPTYGVACSLVIDLAAIYISFARNKWVQGILYLAGGLLFPILTEGQSTEGILFLVSGVTALIYFGLQTASLDKRIVIIVGMLSLLLLLPIVCTHLDFYTDFHLHF
ncbi:hypothetical protein H8B09_25695 [Paenibacillus sp. PR3]|uniref:B box-type domain-containing protein n=1 Tax=Paenibacillus terricola TaxID=2763503 RepID=A0ABR8N1W8_9BACL|nr:hypothetical protein [Paenibacillus terricola]MBD3922175.1 hypothetical protein [Paenibacillus terricola]